MFVATRSAPAADEEAAAYADDDDAPMRYSHATHDADAYAPPREYAVTRRRD